MKEYEKVLIRALNRDLIDITSLERIDWQKAYEFANEHYLQFLMFDYYDTKWSRVFRGSKLYQSWRAEFLFTTFNQIKLYSSAKEVYDFLADEGIDYIILKGETLKELYPNPKVRISGDIDILVRYDTLDSVDQVLNKAGYYKENTSENDISYVKESSVPIEVHYRVFIPKVFNNAEWFDEIIWKNKIPFCRSHCYRLNHEEELVYIIAHSVKHYYYSGSGLRALYDINLYVKQYQSIIRFEKVFMYLSKLECLKFGVYILELCNRLFGLGFVHNEIIDENHINKLLEETLISGVYGEEIYSWHMKDRYESDMKNKGKLIFLDYTMMKDKYPILVKYKVLLPIFWFVRIVNVIHYKNNEARAFIKDKHVLREIEERVKLNDFLKDNYSMNEEVEGK